ncbi:MAG: adenine nucleotide alpha hydrolase [gamma proteobacterium endosymbiont of Lamellibrachia anaximandri]|nr:adenine nucleotide alpha hydrolase [gamma proteobacterium endosymbiont of Lamellibrachia anaximandri]MBL3617807.1 adenine nucleotide alpha hydrolase [gamma proteobacterium endosymbiont of Lamellibrachia anaximandri]
MSDLDVFLHRLHHVKVAVSGGVDSLTLALLAGRALGKQATIFHAVSHAVPDDSTNRVREIGKREGWQLIIVDAGEFNNPSYVSNPYNRCFHCKNSLYSTLSSRMEGTILSGTNIDDLSDFRPGLKAAENFGVVHPFVECGIDKSAIRRICRHLGYEDIAELPASPCLSSRIETGLTIKPEQLVFVHRVEQKLHNALTPKAVRCRIRHEGIAVELDADTLSSLTIDSTNWWKNTIAHLAAQQGLSSKILLEPYRMGSAFVQTT